MSKSPGKHTAAAMLMGLTLAGCPADEDTNDTEAMMSTSPLYGGPTTGSFPDTEGDASSSTRGGSASSSSGSTSTGAAETTGTTGSTGSGTDTDEGSSSTAGSTGISPDYGVPTTGE